MTAQQRIRPAPVVREVRVAATPERAFEVFAAKIDRWWPRSHRLTEAPIADVVIEPRVGGRWFQRDENGVECDVGGVLVYEPGERLVLNWQLSPDWKYDPALRVEVEVRFAADGDQTIVRLEHRDLEQFGERGREMADSVGGDNGWPAILADYAACVEAA